MMKKQNLFWASLVVTLGACQSGPATTGSGEDREVQCMRQAQAAITNPAVELRRGREGGYVEVTMDKGFVQGVKRSVVYDICMNPNSASNGSPLAATSLSFSADEQVIWDGLTDEAKADAYRFIQNGGKLTDFVGQL